MRIWARGFSNFQFSIFNFQFRCLSGEPDMTPEIVLNSKLNQASRRIRALLVYRWVGRFLCGSAGACLVWLLVSKLRWVAEPSPEAIWGILGAAALVGTAAGFLARLTTLDVARLTDKRTQMKERLASAVEFGKLDSADPLVKRQIEDAGSHAGEL